MAFFVKRPKEIFSRVGKIKEKTREGKTKISVTKRGKPSHPTLDGRCYGAKHKIHPILKFHMWKKETQVRNEQNKSLTNCFFEKLANSDLKTVLLKHGCVCK